MVWWWVAVVFGRAHVPVFFASRSLSSALLLYSHCSLKYTCRYTCMFRCMCLYPCLSMFICQLFSFRVYRGIVGAEQLYHAARTKRGIGHALFSTHSQTSCGEDQEVTLSEYPVQVLNRFLFSSNHTTTHHTTPHTTPHHIPHHTTQHHRHHTRQRDNGQRETEKEREEAPARVAEHIEHDSRNSWNKYFGNSLQSKSWEYFLLVMLPTTVLVAPTVGMATRCTPADWCFGVRVWT